MATLNDVIARRKELRKRRRNVFNDDGAAISYYRREYGYPITEDSFISYIFGPHRGVGNHIVNNPTPSDITTFVFSTIASGYVLNKSNITDMYIGSPYRDGIDSSDPGDATQAIIDSTGKDALQIAGDFFENEPVEFFVEARVNDRHDAAFDKSQLVPIKQSLWDSGGLLSNGLNSGLDFSHPDSFDLMVNSILEVVENPIYKLNGVCLNFYRHFGYFTNVIEDTLTPTDQSQIDRMTSLVSTLRSAMDVVSQNLMDDGKEPLLLMVKVADHPDFNRGVALDVDEWMLKDYIDILVPMGYHQFRHIRDSVAWGKRNGVSVIPSMPESRFSNKRNRHSTEGVAGRILQILGSGGDGIEFFNWNYGLDPGWMGPSARIWRNLSREKIIATYGARQYYATWTNQDGSEIGTAGVYPGERFFPHYMPLVSSDNIITDSPVELSVEVYEEYEDVASVEVRVYNDEGEITQCSINGRSLPLTPESYGVTAQAHPSDLVYGINKVMIGGDGIAVSDLVIRVE